MKAFLLAAGKGTRLKPYTDEIPKCLIPICGKPLLGIWLDHLRVQGIREVLINTHHHAQQVAEFISGYAFRRDIHIVIHHEPELLGSAGTILHCREFVDSEDDFMILYADNLTNIDLRRFVEFHGHCRQRQGILTMGLFHTPDPSACGIAELGPDQRIVAFDEKPQKPRSDLANAGIYMASRDILGFFPQTQPTSGTVLDFGYHILPLLTDRMYGYPITEYLRDIGTVDSYHRALTEWKEING